MGHCIPAKPDPRLQRSCHGAALAWASAWSPAEPQVAQATAGTQGGASLIQRKAFLAPCAEVALLAHECHALALA
eukprot:9486437-Heterocapsa_arctica.AAC.1